MTHAATWRYLLVVFLLLLDWDGVVRAHADPHTEL